MMNPRASLLSVLSACLALVGGTREAFAEKPNASLVERSAQAAASRGASADLLSGKQGKLAKNGTDSFQVKLSPKQCAVFAASVDETVPDVALTAEIKGGPALSDETSGADATLRYCAGEAETQVIVRVRAEKATRFSVGVYAVRPTGEAGEASKEATSGPEVAPSALSLSKRLSRLVAQRGAGMVGMTPVREEDVSTQEPRKREVVLVSDQCYRVLAVGEAPATGLELTLRDAKGVVQASSAGKLELSVPEAASFCPKTGGAHTVAIRALGSGSRVAWQVVGAQDPDLEARFPVGGKSKELLATRMRDIHRNQAAKAPVMAFEQGQLGTAEVHTSSFDVVGGRCYLAVAAGVPSLRALELEMVDQRGNTIGRAQEQSSINMLRVCADVSGRWTLRAKAFKGYGAFGVQVFIAPDL